MAKQLEGVSERILNCAKAEFLDKGYTDASLRAIAAAADTSTNSIYVRFGDKEGLFSAIVEPALNEMTERFLKIQEEFHRMDSTAQSAHMAEYADAAPWSWWTTCTTTWTNSGCCSTRPTARAFITSSMNWYVLRSNTPISTWRPPAGSCNARFPENKHRPKVPHCGALGRFSRN